MKLLSQNLPPEHYWLSNAISDWLISGIVHLLSQSLQSFEYVAPKLAHETNFSYSLSDWFNIWWSVPFDQLAGSSQGVKGQYTQGMMMMLKLQKTNLK